MREVGGKKILTLTVVDPKAVKGFPANARLTIKLNETKQIELVDFGTLGNPKTAVEIANQEYVDPSCQLRIANADADRLGVLLGSSASWRLNSDNPEQTGGVRGLLNFLPAKIAPRTWKLIINEDTHPVIHIDNRIPDPRSWAKSDPIFVGTIMPAIIFQVFDDILSHPNPEETDWMNDWIRWADGLMPGNARPQQPDSRERREWVDGLIDTFCQRHRLSDRIVDQFIQGDAA